MGMDYKFPWSSLKWTIAHINEVNYPGIAQESKLLFMKVDYSSQK